MNRRLTRAAIWVAAPILVFTACSENPENQGSAADSGGAEPTREDLSWDPTKLGPYRAGYRTYKHSYEPTSKAFEKRELTINVWYPTDAKTGDLPKYFNTWDADFFYAFDGEQAIQDAPAAKPAVGDAYPVLAVSHGANGFGASTASLNHFFASHGWVVVAPDHFGDTLSDLGKKSAMWLRLARPLDVSAAIDSLASLSKSGGGELAGKPDTTKVAMAGHSRGGVTTWAISGAKFDRARIEKACKDKPQDGCDAKVYQAYDDGARDERIVCGVPMAGAGGFDPWFGDTGHSKAAVAQLQMSGSEDKDQPQKVYDAAWTVPLTWIHIDGACHQAFAMGACPKLANKLAFPINDVYALAFARYHVLGDRTAKTLALLDGSDKTFPQVKLQRKNVK